MKTTKEIVPILTALHCINYTGPRDNDIYNITEYAFRRIIGANTNLITLACVGKTKDEVMPEVLKMLELDTNYHKYEKSDSMKLRPAKIYNVLVDWITEEESEVKSFLFSTRARALEQFKKECLQEIEFRKGDSVYCDEDSEKHLNEMIAKYDEHFNIMNREENADYVIECSENYFSCYKESRYSEYHINIRIIEQAMDAPAEEQAKGGI